MKETKLPDFTERLNAQAEARKALLEKFKPRPTVQAIHSEGVFETSAQKKVRELEEVRARRAAEKEAARLAKEKAEEDLRLARENDEEFQLQVKRDDRKARKAAAKADARQRREQKSQMRRTG